MAGFGYVKKEEQKMMPSVRVKISEATRPGKGVASAIATVVFDEETAFVIHNIELLVTHEDGVLDVALPSFDGRRAIIAVTANLREAILAECGRAWRKFVAAVDVQPVA